jgi:hypothetical protein
MLNYPIKNTNVFIIFYKYYLLKVSEFKNQGVKTW